MGGIKKRKKKGSKGVPQPKGELKNRRKKFKKREGLITSRNYKMKGRNPQK